MQRVELFPSMESAIAYIMQGLTFYIDSRGSVKIQNGKICSYSISWVSSWFRNSQLSLDRVLLAASTMLKLDSCNGELARSLAVINSAIHLNVKLENAYKNRPYYSIAIEKSLLHSLLLEAKVVLMQFQGENIDRPGSKLVSSPL